MQPSRFFELRAPESAAFQKQTLQLTCESRQTCWVVGFCHLPIFSPSSSGLRSVARGGEMDVRELGSIPYHPLPLALGVARYPPYPCPGCWCCSSPGVATRWWARRGGCIRSGTAHWAAAALGPRRQPRPTPSPRRDGLAGVDEQALPAGEEEVSPRAHHGQKMQSLVCATGGNSPHHTSASSASPATAASTHPTPTLFKLPVACKVPYHPLPPRASVYIHLPTPRN